MNVVVEKVNPRDYDLVAHLFNQMFRPEREAAHFKRRLEARPNPLFLVASVNKDAVGFYLGMELKPSVHFAWLCGVNPDVRRMSIATQLMHAAEEWARDEKYDSIRFECDNHQRAMLHFGISAEYDIGGIRWDVDRSQNLIIFERMLDKRRDAAK